MTPRSLSAGFIALAVNAVIMSVELLATRLLFPAYGNTVFTWSAVISVIIAGLFIGYMAGGLLAERARDKLGLMFFELLASGLAVAAVPWLARAVLLGPATPQAVTPPLAGCFLVFGLPAALMAAVPPAAVGVMVEDGWGAALSSGVVSALSAAGSIAGTLGATFYLIPHWGLRSLFTVFGAGLGALAALAWLAAGRKAGLGNAAAFLACAGLGAAAASSEASLVPAERGRLLHSKDSAYQLVRVVEQGEGESAVRVLLLDSTQEGARAVSSGEVAFEYMRAWRIFPNILASRTRSRILFIGGGAYAMPLSAAAALPGAEVEVAELDPAVEEAGRRFFRAGSAPNLKTVLADGRRRVRENPGAYDGVFVDAYLGVYAIPFHLTTAEFFAEAKAGLKPGGFVALNVIGDPLERSGLFCSMAKTLTTVYPWVRAYPVSRQASVVQNVILVASTRPEGFGGKDPLAGAGFAAPMAFEALPCRAPEVLTDDRAPVEWLAARYRSRR